MSITRRRPGDLRSPALALLSTLAVLATGAQPAAADTTQLFACFSPLTSTYATFPIPETASGDPGPTPGTAEFTGLSVIFGIPTTLVLAGIGAAVLDFALAPAAIGSGGPTADGVNSVANTTTMKLTASNTVEATAPVSGGVTMTFFVVFDGANPATLQIYVENSPGSWSGSGTTGLHVVPILPVVVPLGPAVIVTSNGGGNITLASALGPLPANPAGAPTLAERNSAPLILLNNLGVQANFFCWPGVSQGALDPSTGLPSASPGFSPAAAASAIDTVPMNVSGTTTTTASSTTTTTTFPANICASKKLKAAGKKAACLLGVNAKAAKRGQPVDGDKVQRCKDKFSNAFAKAEAKPPCLTTLDTSNIEDKVDLFVDDVTSDLVP